MIEPELADFIAEAVIAYPPGAETRPIAETRAFYDAFAARMTPPRPPGIVAEDRALAADGREIPLRLYRGPAKPTGLVLYFHGGGFILGSLDSHDIVTAWLAAETGTAVVAVDYRLAPEHLAPAAFADCFAVAEAAIAGGLPYSDIDGLPIVLAGDSAGGTLAAGVAMKLRDRGHAPLAGLALIYPLLARDPTPPARDDEAEAPMLTLSEVRGCVEAYLGGQSPGPYDFPLDTDRFDGLPPVLALPVEHDPLRDDAYLFAERVRAAGGTAEVLLGTGLAHGCVRARERSPGVRRLYSALATFVTACTGTGR